MINNKTELNDEQLNKVFGGRGVDENTPMCKTFEPLTGKEDGKTCGSCKFYDHGECLKGIK